jgi:outer membrane protein assembly factor BamD
MYESFLYVYAKMINFAVQNMIMKKKIAYIFFAVVCLSSCSSVEKAFRSADNDYRYEAAKQMYVEGKYSWASDLLGELIPFFKGSERGEESLFLLAMSNYEMGDYETASTYFKKYYTTYVKGKYNELARFYSGKSLYYDTVDPRLDQSSTITAINEFQTFLDYYPYTAYKTQTQTMIDELQDRLVEKEYLAAKLYYDLGDYIGNSTYGGSNFQACVVTAQNALREYPYSKRREDLSLLVVRAKYSLAKNSAEEKQEERYREVVDEAYGFLNEFPESKQVSDVNKMLESANKSLKK